MTLPQPSQSEMSLRDLAYLGWRRRRLILGGTGAALALALAFVLFWPPTYQASALVKVPESGHGLPGFLKDLSALTSSGDPLETYLQVAGSRNVAARVLQSLKLWNQPEYRGLSPEKMLERLDSQISLSCPKLSNLVLIRARAGKPNLAADLANAWAAAFMQANLEFSRQGAASQRRFLEEQLVQVKARLLQAEDLLKAFSARHHALASLAGAPAPGSSGREPLVQLKSKLLNLQIERANLASRYGEGLPQMQQIEAQLREARAQWDQEMSRLPGKEIELQRLQRETRSDEALYSLMLEKLQEARLAENVDDSGMVLVDAALPPEHPAKPRKALSLGLAPCLGLLFSLGLAFLLEQWQDQVGREEDLRALSSLPHLGTIPDFHFLLPAAPRQRFSADYLIHQPAFQYSYYQEAFKILRTNLGFAAPGRRLFSLALLSPSQGEGKSLANANLAISLALAGKKTLLVDADLRRPSLHRLFGLPHPGPHTGLPLLLAGRRDQPALPLPGPVHGLWLLPNGLQVPNPAELLASPGLEACLEDWEKNYEAVVFDAAPILPVTDSLVLASRLDGCILLARSGQTSRGDFRQALQALQSVKARVLGTLLNAVDVQAQRYAYRQSYGAYHPVSNELEASPRS